MEFAIFWGTPLVSLAAVAIAASRHTDRTINRARAFMRMVL